MSNFIYFYLFVFLVSCSVQENIRDNTLPVGFEPDKPENNDFPPEQRGFPEGVVALEASNGLIIPVYKTGVLPQTVTGANATGVSQNCDVSLISVNNSDEKKINTKLKCSLGRYQFTGPVNSDENSQDYEFIKLGDNEMDSSWEVKWEPLSDQGSSNCESIGSNLSVECVFPEVQENVEKIVQVGIHPPESENVEPYQVVTQAAVLGCDETMKNNFPFGNSTESQPIAQAPEPVIICSADQFNRIDSELGGGSVARLYRYYYVGADLDFAGINPNIIGKMYSGKNRFAGLFDGGNHDFKNISIISSTEEAVGGLFGFSVGIIKNINLHIVEIQSEGIVGGLVGIASGYGYISNINITIDGNITGKSNSVGGLAGRASGYTPTEDLPYPPFKIHNINIRGSNNESTIKSVIDISKETETYVGGAIGFVQGPTIISQVTVDQLSIQGSSFIGGVIGSAESSAGDNQPQIKLSHVGKNTTVQGDIFIGGFIGLLADGHISNSFSLASVKSGEDSGLNYFGGFSGYLNRGGSISDSFTSSTITCTGSCGNVGSFVGIKTDTSGTVQSSFWNNEVSNFVNGVAIGKTLSDFSLDADNNNIADLFETESWDLNFWELDPSKMVDGLPVLKDSVITE